MPRPSRNIDRRLIEVGLQALSESGCSGLNVRDVVQRADVNLGMFHYHFKTKEAFIRVLLQDVYERIYATLEKAVSADRSPKENLRAVLVNMAGMVAGNRKVLMALLTDLKRRDPVALEFVKDNFSRHLSLITGLVVEAQKKGQIRQAPVPQLVLMLMSAGVMANVLVDVLETNLSEAPASLARVPDVLLSEQAIAERIDMVLKGVSP